MREKDGLKKLDFLHTIIDRIKINGVPGCCDGLDCFRCSQIMGDQFCYDSKVLAEEELDRLEKLLKEALNECERNRS